MRSDRGRKERTEIEIEKKEKLQTNKRSKYKKSCKFIERKSQ